MRKAANLLWGLLLVCLLSTGVLASQDYEYTLQDDTAVLTRYVGTDSYVTVPAAITVDGVSYKTVLDSETVFKENTNLRSVTLQQGVGFLDQRARNLFKNCTNLTQVHLGQISGLVSIRAMFMGCESLVSLDVSGLDTSQVRDMCYVFYKCKGLSSLTGYENWDTGAVELLYMSFSGINALERIDLSRWDLSNVKNTGWCFQSCAASQILLPENLAVISAGFFNHVSRYPEADFVIPSGVKKIGYAHTFYDFGSRITEFKVAPGNTAYQAVDGILYSADGTELLAIPRNKTFPDGVFTVPQGVSFMGELSFSRNYNIRELILPDSFEITVVDKQDPRYIIDQDVGNLNAGNSLSIAIYSYTGITRYGVRPTNPHYKAIDGVLYTKDGTALVAVPTRYDGYIAVPEGTVRWENEAMWGLRNTAVDSYMGKATGVSIPQSMTWIDDAQLDKLNRLQKAYQTFTITVHPDNPAYRLDESGQLVAKIAVSALQIRLSEDRFVYDGTEKTPQVCVWDGDLCLVQDRDYKVSYENNTQAGAAAVYITGLGEYGGTVPVSFTVEQAPMPDTPVPELEAWYGQSLREVELPENFEWATDSAVGTVGQKQFAAVQKSRDPNYADRQVRIPVLVKPRPVRPVITVEPKAFDFDCEASFTVQLEGLVNGDRVVLVSSAVTVRYTSQWPGQEIPVSVSEGFFITGPDAAQYALCKPEGVTGTIEHNWWLYGGAGGAAVLIGAACLWLYIRKKRKKE